MDEHGVEGGLFRLLAAGEDHPGHPEEDDVIPCDQHVGGVEVVQVLGLLRPAQGGEGPQGGGEPGVQHVGVPLDVGAAALLAHRGVLAGETVMWPQSSQYHTGIWWPHHSWREMHQSWTFSIQLV